MAAALPDVTEQSFQTDVLSSDKPVLVDFWAPWCAPCRMLSPIVEKLAGQLGERVKFVKVNTDENPTLAGQYGISGIPCMIVFKGGREVARLVGLRPENEIAATLNAHLAAA